MINGINISPENRKEILIEKRRNKNPMIPPVNIPRHLEHKKLRPLWEKLLSSIRWQKHKEIMVFENEQSSIGPIFSSHVNFNFK